MKEKNIKEENASFFSDKKLTKLTKKLIENARSTLKITNDFNPQKNYDICFTVDNIKYRAINFQDEVFSGFYLKRTLNETDTLNILKTEGLTIMRNNHPKTKPFGSISYEDKSGKIISNTQETVDKIREFLTDFTAKAT